MCLNLTFDISVPAILYSFINLLPLIFRYIYKMNIFLNTNMILPLFLHIFFLPFCFFLLSNWSMQVWKNWQNASFIIWHLVSPGFSFFTQRWQKWQWQSKCFRECWSSAPLLVNPAILSPYPYFEREQVFELTFHRLHKGVTIIFLGHPCKQQDYSPPKYHTNF